MTVVSSIEPVPIDLPHPGIATRGARLARTMWLAVRYFTPVVARCVVRRPGRAARAARRMFEDLGATYIKFGQFAASAPGIIGEAAAEEFRGCLDTGPAVPAATVRSIVEQELARPIDEIFARFDDAPLAAASIAVVHRATLRDGTDVAVKVLRPGIERKIAADIRIMEALARFMAARGADQAYNMVGLIVGLRAQVAEELDLRNEARTMDVFRGLFRDYGLSLLLVPRVYHALSSRHVLTMAYLDGAPIDHLERAREFGADPAALVRELLRAWVLTGLRVGAFHADIHAGNLLVLRDGRLGMLDWGIVARLDRDTRRLLRGLAEAAIGREEAWAEIAAHMADVQGPSMRALGLTDDQIVRFVRSTMEPVLTKPLTEVSMASLFMNGDDVVRLATGEAPPRRSIRDRLRVMRAAARSYREAAACGSFESSTMRMSFLASKQLVYLERYGRMYVPDDSILGDPAFVRAALEETRAPEVS